MAERVGCHPIVPGAGWPSRRTAYGRRLKDLFLQNIKVIVLPDQIAVPKAAEAFNSDGSLKDPKQQAAVEGLGTKLVQVISKLRS
ncbi:MAG: hypothetical protein HY803_16020 [candidate division NC10 bacterium]|nr:hypothetical protein [candidate division NC10 bacterium]